MDRFLNGVWRDDTGSGLLSAEWLFLVAILAIGLVTGLVAMRQALLSELVETADALLALNQSYADAPLSRTCEASTAASTASDTTNSISSSSVTASTSIINQAACD
jgi:hypothetical protein